MSLFQKSVIQKYLNNLDDSVVQKAYKHFNRFYGDKERLENIKLLKEENYQEGFLREIFVDVLGYTINPDKNYNLTTEFKNLTDSGKADGAILLDDKAIGVIELKSTKTTDLESIKKQAFSYKNNQPDCRYVITSNFEKLRIYIDNATEYEEFNLFTLSPEQFTFLYLILSKESIFSGLPLKLKDESRLHEETVSDKLYKDYSSFKRNVFNNLVKNNAQHDKLFLFHKSQKLLDRLLFVLFAEDRGLIPPNAISKIIDQWKKFAELDEPVSLYSRFVKLFHHLNGGHKYPNYELPAYNGGLFRKDEILDKMIIDDEILYKDTLKLSTYDFNTEIDVNILGHIFEHSINEIEELTAQLEGKEANRNKSKRKKEGIFYTPKFITKYIVENTVGALCEEKKKVLKIDEIETEIIKNSRTAKGKLTKKAEELLTRLEAYRNYLVSLKILDPACGSGAFLNQALEFLINEHEMIDNYRKELEQDALGLYDVSKSILENNLYGVDINEEAVEIAKLSMWLRTAEKGRKLSDLSTNIKCGNSLIDNPEIAGDKAFKWEKEFQEIMANGGFDVVIGNPPYVNANELKISLSDTAYKYLKKQFQTAKGTVDLYIYFIERATSIAKEGSFISFITPNRYLSASYGIALREFLYKNIDLISISDFSDLRVFKDASTYPIISTFRKIRISKFLITINKFSEKLGSIDLAKSSFISKDKLVLLVDKIWGFLLNDKLPIVEKIINQSEPLTAYCKINATSTAREADNYHALINERSGIKLINTGTIDRYSNNWGYEELIDKGEKYLMPYLPNNSSNISENRKLLYSTQKIILAKIAIRTEGFFDEFGEYASINTNCIHSFNSDVNPYYVLSFINSKLYQYLFECFFEGLRMAGGYLLYSAPNLSSTYMKRLNDKEQEIFTSPSKLLQSKNLDLNSKIYSFLSRIQSNFPIEKLSNKLKEFYKYDFKTFLTELKKKKITLTLKQQDEWEPYFNNYKDEINQLQEEINKTDNEIDKMVYQLYGLTDEEINIVEDSVK